MSRNNAIFDVTPITNLVKVHRTHSQEVNAKCKATPS